MTLRATKLRQHRQLSRDRSRVPRAIALALAASKVPDGSALMMALSGGPDSIVLLHALLEIRHKRGFRLIAAHLNHRLRGPESDRDEAFVRVECDRLGVELLVERAKGLTPDTPNLEEHARDLRYDFFARASARARADYVVLAHHADDQAETVLMRLLRGAGVAGLAGMSAIGPGNLLRPMLKITRTEILAYLSATGAEFVEDSSNRSFAPLRNRIRHLLLPEIERDYAPGARTRIAALADEMRMLDAYVAREAARAMVAIRADNGSLDVARLAEIDPALRVPVLREWLRGEIGSLRRVERAHLDALLAIALSASPSGEVVLPGGWRATREYAALRLVRAPLSRHPHPFAIELATRGTTVVAQARYAFDAEVLAASGLGMPSDNHSAIFDLGALANDALVVRSFREGDRIRPLGLDGTRKLKEIFIDAKIPRARRATMPVVASGPEVVWLPGLVRSDRALVTANSRVAVRISAYETSSQE